MSPDFQIISRHSHFDVTNSHQDVLWRDGSTVALHRVQVNGYTHTFLRAVRPTGAHWLVFDLRKLAPSIECDLLSLPERDAIGTVLYTLRQAYTDADSFLVATLREGVRTAIWMAPEVETTPMVPA